MELINRIEVLNRVIEDDSPVTERTLMFLQSATRD